MKNINKKSWRDVTINEYFDLSDKLNDKSLNDYEKEIIKISFITDMDEDEVWSLNLGEFRQYQVEALWINEFNINEKVNFKKIKINNSDYNIDTNLQNFTVAQYVDFQSFYPKYKSNPKLIGNILACFIVPCGKKYGEGYEIQDIVRLINSHLDIMTAEEIMFFFLKQYLILTRATVNYLNWLMKKATKKMKYEEKKKWQEEWEMSKKNILDGFRSLTTLAN